MDEYNTKAILFYGSYYVEMYKCNITHIYMCNAITMCSDVANRVTRMSNASNMTVVPPA